MKFLQKTIQDLEAGVAVGHFNVATLEQLKAIAGAARNLKQPVIVGVSEGERDFMGLSQIVALVDSYKKEGLEMYLNADHTRSLDRIREAAEAGFDSVIFDAADRPWEENAKLTKEAVRIAKQANPNILVEGELGYIGTSSKLLDEVPEGAATESPAFTAPDQARKFVEETGVDMLAPAVGNIHGMLKNSENPALDMERIREIHQATGVPLVLHGGSGISDENFRKAISAGIQIIHVSTELRAAWRQGIEQALKRDPDEIAPYRVLGDTVQALESIVEQKMRTFRGK